MSVTTASDRVLHLRALRRDLQILCRSLGDEAGSVEAVGVGEELWSLIQEAQKHLDTMKGIIRAEVGSDPGKHTLDGADGAYCNVNVRGPRPVVRRGSDLDHVRRVIGDQSFNRLFTTRNSMALPVRDFMQQVAGVTNPDATAAIMAVVDLKTDPARVSFAKDRSPR